MITQFRVHALAVVSGALAAGSGAVVAESPVSWMDQVLGKAPEAISGNPADESDLVGSGQTARPAERDLSMLKGSEPRKLLIARTLREHTAVSNGWIAEALHMKSASNVCKQLRRMQHTKRNCQ